MTSVRIVCLALGFCCAHVASAQDPDDIATPTTLTAPVSPSYLEYRRSELEYLSGRSKVAVISSAAVAAVGLALVLPAAVTECVRVASSSSFDELRCTTTGKALMGVGMPLLIGGATAVLTTAIMLGVRRGKLRHIDDELAYQRHRSIRWDPQRLAFAF